ncbi:hypothetical protein JB92DRAFT_1900036 [Gautieria morchelliformis]|nr:hypothetical protein JB92DRAFT_1900036 [Gautieria morchelliformis]
MRPQPVVHCLSRTHKCISASTNPKAVRCQTSKCGTCPLYSLSGQRPYSPQGLPPNPVKPRERPVPIRPQMAHPPFPASVSHFGLASPLPLQAFRKHRRPKATIQPLPSPIPSTSPKPLKTTTTPPGGSLTKPSATLLMAPKSPSPIIRSGILRRILGPRKRLQFLYSTSTAAVQDCLDVGFMVSFTVPALVLY